MFGRKSKSSESSTKAKAIKSSHLETKSASDCGGRCTKSCSAKASDMTSGGRSTKSCGAKSSCKETRASTKTTSAKSKTTKSCS